MCDGRGGMGKWTALETSQSPAAAKMGTGMACIGLSTLLKPAEEIDDLRQRGGGATAKRLVRGGGAAVMAQQRPARQSVPSRDRARQVKAVLSGWSSSDARARRLNFEMRSCLPWRWDEECTLYRVGTDAD